MSNSKRVGKIQSAIIKWVTDGGYTYIGAGTQNHRQYGLGGRTLEEIQRSVDSLVARGLIKQHKPGFYSLPNWVRDRDKTLASNGEAADHA